MQLLSLNQAPSLFTRPRVINMIDPKDEKRTMFAAVEKSDQDLANADKVRDLILMKRSDEIEKILLKYGKGPYMYNNESVRIVKRKSQHGKRVIHFFRAVSKLEPEDID